VDQTQALREASDSLLRDLEVLAAIEEEKRELRPGDPRLVELAGRVEEVAQRVLAGTVRQHQLTQSVNADVEAGVPGVPDRPIAATPRSITAILAEWRDAERRASAAEPDSADAVEANALVDALREEYRRAYEAARTRKG
jgi:hypothetical protein